MIEILEFVFGSFWRFVGFVMVLGGAGELLFQKRNRFLRMLSIRKHGWPPAECDADGDFKPEPEDKE